MIASTIQKPVLTSRAFQSTPVSGLRFVVAIALLFAFTPGMSEVIEAAVHLVTHADLPHHDEQSDGDCQEHSCTPLAHHCGCHGTMSAQVTSRDVAMKFMYATDKSVFAVTTKHDRNLEPPPLRPPIA